MPPMSNRVRLNLTFFMLHFVSVITDFLSWARVDQDILLRAKSFKEDIVW